ncbi:MAG TPA: DUF4349 domain-containing protein [Terrabacter sp.]|nr:DUF4349 domain-containing protein [Terrabacter sp.]
MTALSPLLRSPSPSQSPASASGPQPPSRPRRRRVLGVLAVTVALLAVAVPLGLHRVDAGSSAPAVGARAGDVRGPAQGNGSSSAGGVTGAPEAQQGAGSATSSAGGSGTSESGAVIEPKIARTAWLGLKVTDLAGAAARARVVATEAGGQVTSEDVVTSTDPTGGLLGGSQGGATTGRPDSSSGGVAPSPGVPAPNQPGAVLTQVGVDQARMVLNVPAKGLDQVLTQLSTLGTVSYRSSQSQDVTDAYVDTRSRIQPMRDGIERVRALLARTTDLQQVITLETELSRRQAELDSLTQRLAQLDAMTTTSDVTLSMWTDTTPPAQSGGGLSGGLRSAWDSLLGSLTVVLTGLAALLPWLLVLVPLGLLGLRLWRRRTAGAPAASGSPGSAD